jgi:hypothetical protein
MTKYYRLSSKFYLFFHRASGIAAFTGPALRTARAVFSWEDRLLLNLCLPVASNLSSNEVKERKTHFTITAESSRFPPTISDESLFIYSSE